ncbi:MAG: hypothetical protein HYY40_01180 [Bacteroidetes bacterium]|nr:hypothetical protein [Bacteroidota bacterium]
MHTSKRIWDFMIIPTTLTVVAFLLNIFPELYKSNWNFNVIHIDEFTLMVPVLLFGWQIITAVNSKRVLMNSYENSERVLGNSKLVLESLQKIPDDIQKRTRDEVNHLKSDNEEFRRQLAKGVVEHDLHYYRTLTYKKDEGSLFNGFGDEKERSRNVLFSNKTINLIFREVRNLNTNNSNVLYTIGKKASERFAAEMVKDIESQSKSSNSDLIQWIKKWIEFDSDAGFGKFELEGEKSKWKNNMVILLKYSFLTQDYLDNKSNRGLCYFMTGYLEGIINSFPHNVLQPFGLNPGSITIEHNVESLEECVSAGRSVHDGCRYHIIGKK